MIYRGFLLAKEPYAIKGLYCGEAVAIRFFGKLVSYADSVPLARRAVDCHVKSGMWPPNVKGGCSE